MVKSNIAKYFLEEKKIMVNRKVTYNSEKDAKNKQSKLSKYLLSHSQYVKSVGNFILK